MKNKKFNMDDYLLFEKPVKHEVSLKVKIIYQVIGLITILSLLFFMMIIFLNNGEGYRLVVNTFLLAVVSYDFYKVQKSIYVPNLFNMTIHIIITFLVIYEVYSTIW